MTKIDKSLYTKPQIKKLLEERRRQKAIEQIKVETTTAISHEQQKLTDHTYTEYGFVIGNGTSRKGIDLNHIKQYGKVYACNAMYREFEPDYLIAVDVKMINEINQTGWQNNHQVWTNSNKAYRNYTGFNYFQPSKGWSSGPTALDFATQHTPRFKKIFILGFDYTGIDNGKQKIVNNMYAGTPNYKRTTDSATYYGNWVKQTCTILKQNPSTVFYRVILPDYFVPNELNRYSNLKHITVKDFKEMFYFP
jgi:hypothetical protein